MTSEPWFTEPNDAVWTDQATGLPCMIVRATNLGHLCGYVGVPPKHKAFGEDLDGVLLQAIDVHGGVTYSSRTNPLRAKEGLLWWVGFDCAQHGDLIPFMHPVIGGFMGFNLTGTYRDFPFVRDQCASLAMQLQAL